MNFYRTFRFIVMFAVILSVLTAQAQSTMEISDSKNIENVRDHIEKYKTSITDMSDDEMQALSQLEEALQELSKYIKGESDNDNITEIADRYCKAALLVDSFGQPFQSVERIMTLGREYYWLGVYIGKYLASQSNYKGECTSMGSWYDA